MDNQNNQKPNQESSEDNIPPRHSEFISESQNKIPKQVRDDEAERDSEPTPSSPPESTPPLPPEPVEGPEDILAGTDENPIPAPESTTTSSPTPSPHSPEPTPRHSEQPTPRHSEFISESNTKSPTEQNKEDAVIPSSTGNPEQNNKNKVSIKPKSKKTWIWLVIILFVIIAGGVTYYLNLWPAWLKSPISSIIEPKVEPEESFIPLFSRASTIPNGILTIQNNKPTVVINNLEPSLNRQYTYKLTLSGANSQLELGSFDGSDADGSLMNLDNSPITLRSVDNIDNYNTATVKIASKIDSGQSSTILEGELIKSETNSIITAELNFPYLFNRVNAGIELSKVQGGESTIKFEASNLPDLSIVGYEYELRFVEFEGPYVASELTLGRFQGNMANTTNFTSKTSKNLSRFTQIVVSLEPIWDNDPTISQIKPFSGEI